jgi:hypothetical protein
MVKVKMSLDKLTRPQKIESTRFWVLQITGNPNFPTPSPTAATLATGANQLEAATLAAKGGGPDDWAAMRLKEEALNLLLRQFAGYVEITANANPAAAEAIILSAGLQVRSSSTRKVKPFSVKPTGNPGEVMLYLSGVSGGTVEFQISTDISSEANWKTFNVGTRRRITKGDLSYNTRYYFRARAVTSKGHTEWSEVCIVYLPA